MSAVASKGMGAVTERLNGSPSAVTGTPPPISRKLLARFGFVVSFRTSAALNEGERTNQNSPAFNTLNGSVWIVI